MSRFLAAACAVLAFAVLVTRSPQAWADAKQDIAAKAKEAMSNYDNFESETARKLLTEALSIAKKSKLDNDPAVAKVHLYLAIVYFAGLNQADSAKLEFLTAAQIDPKIQIEPAYRRPDLAKLLDDARLEAANTTPVKVGPVGPDTGPTPPIEVNCSTVMGVQHSALETAAANSVTPMVAYIGEDVVAARVSIMYRVEGSTDFSEAPMAKDGCKYTGNIPKEMVKGKMIHYYIAGLTSTGKVVSSSGSSQVPNLIEITAAVGSDTEVPTEKIVKVAGPSKPGKKSVFFGVAVGTGGGAVSGTTEITDSTVNCGDAPLCVAPALLTFMPELGFYLSPRSSISLVARLGLPIGADTAGHATLAPAALVRFRYGFAADGNGFGISGSLGGGTIRNVVEITDPQTKMALGNDTIAMGPLLVGGSVGYSAAMSGSLRFFADVAATAGIPVVKELGSARLGFGVQLDVSLGVAAGF